MNLMVHRRTEELGLRLVGERSCKDFFKTQLSNYTYGLKSDRHAYSWKELPTSSCSIKKSGRMCSWKVHF